MVNTSKDNHHVFFLEDVKYICPYDVKYQVFKSEIHLNVGGVLYSTDTPEQIYNQFKQTGPDGR